MDQSVLVATGLKFERRPQADWQAAVRRSTPGIRQRLSFMTFRTPCRTKLRGENASGSSAAAPRGRDRRKIETAQGPRAGNRRRAGTSPLLPGAQRRWRRGVGVSGYRRSHPSRDGMQQGILDLRSLRGGRLRRRLRARSAASPAPARRHPVGVRTIWSSSPALRRKRSDLACRHQGCPASSLRAQRKLGRVP